VLHKAIPELIGGQHLVQTTHNKTELISLTEQSNDNFLLLMWWMLHTCTMNTYYFQCWSLREDSYKNWDQMLPEQRLCGVSNHWRKSPLYTNSLL